jgi:tripartite-type tricarboxylate transporter receptor subunit TctC
MLRSKALLRLTIFIAAACVSGIAKAETYPSRPITFIVPWGPGGGADQLARVSSKLMEPELKVSLPVINVPGATGQNGLTKLATSPADGYTISVMTGDTFSLFASPTARFKLDQFTPLAIMIQQPSGLFVSATGPLQTWDDVLKVVKEKELRTGITGYGSPDDLTINYFKRQGLKFQGVPFAEPGMRYASVVGGQSDILYEQAGDVRSFLDGKQIKPVIFFSKKPFNVFPDVPYSGKLGYQVFLPQFRVILVRSETDPAIVKKLSEALAVVAKNPEYHEYLKQQYADPDSFVPADKSLQYMKDWLSEAGHLLSANAGTVAASPK